MPLTLTLTEGVIPKGTEQKAVAKLTDALLERHGLTGNALMKRNITATVHVLPKGTTFSGGEEFAGAWIEWKVPAITFGTREIQKGYGEDVVNIIQELSGGAQPADNIYFNVVHSVDGAWNFEGVAMSNEEIGAALAREAQAV